MPDRSKRTLARTILWCLTLIAMAISDGYAKCASFPAASHIRADVKVWSCVGITFDAVSRKFYDFGPLYGKGASFSGTLMAINVNHSRVVWDDDGGRKKGDRSGLWKKGEALTVFVPASAEETCPTSLPADLTVETREQCCDVLPLRGQCLVPRHLQIVVVTSK